MYSVKLMSLMEFPSIITLFHIKLVSSLVFLSIFTTTLNPIIAAKDCVFPAIFSLGASNADTGGMAAAAFSLPNSPNGETYFHRPSGRFSDGRIILDFIGNIVFSFISIYLSNVSNEVSLISTSLASGKIYFG